MAIKNVEIQDDTGTIYYPHTDASVVKCANGQSVETQFANNSKQVPHLGTTTNVGDTYNVNTTEIINVNQKFTIKFNTPSVSAPKLKMNNISTAWLIKKANGSNAKLYDSVYTLFFDGSNFIQLGEGGDELSGDFISENLLSGKTGYSDNSLVKLTGTMINRDDTWSDAVFPYYSGKGFVGVMPAKGYYTGTIVQHGGTMVREPNFIPENLLSGKTYFGMGGTIKTHTSASNRITLGLGLDGSSTVGKIFIKPEAGYYDGIDGWVETVESNFIPENLLSGKSYFGLTGTMPRYTPNNYAGTQVGIGEQGIIYIHPNEGYWEKGANVYLQDPNFVPSNLLAGKSYFGMTGTMPNNGAINRTPTTSSQSIPAGYTTGGIVSAVLVPTDNVLAGTVIAGATGTMPIATELSTPLSFKGAYGQILITPKVGYYNGSKVIGIFDSDFAPSNFLSGVNVFGLIGTATVSNMGGKGNASGTAYVDGTGNVQVSGLSFTPRVVAYSYYESSCFNYVMTAPCFYGNYAQNAIGSRSNAPGLYTKASIGMISGGFSSFASIGIGGVSWEAWE